MSGGTICSRVNFHAASAWSTSHDTPLMNSAAPSPVSQAIAELMAAFSRGGSHIFSIIKALLAWKTNCWNCSWACGIPSDLSQSSPLPIAVMICWPKPSSELRSDKKLPWSPPIADPTLNAPVTSPAKPAASPTSGPATSEPISVATPPIARPANDIAPASPSVDSLRFENQSTAPLASSNILVAAGANVPPMVMATFCNLVVNLSHCLLRVSSCFSATSFVTPPISLIFSVSFERASPPSASKTFIPGPARWPNSSMISAVVAPDSFRSERISEKSRICPPESVTETPNSSSFDCIALVGFDSFESAWRSVVPAFDPLIPASERNPIAALVSSTDIPSPSATGAT